MDALAANIGSLSVTKPFGFLDLPGELRNRTYEAIIASAPYLPDSKNLIKSHPQIRKEYTTLYLPLENRRIPYRHVDAFLAAFYTQESIPYLTSTPCSLTIAPTRSHTVEQATIDLLRLSLLVRHCPGLTLKWNVPPPKHWQADYHSRIEKDLSDCVAISAQWTDAQRSIIVSAELEHRGSWPSRWFCFRLQLKKGLTEVLRFDKTREMLGGLGFEVPEKYEKKGKCVFFSLRIEVEREEGGVSQTAHKTGRW